MFKIMPTTDIDLNTIKAFINTTNINKTLSTKEN